MNGVHDFGGTHGHGPIRWSESEPVFHEDWERKVCAVVMGVWFTGAWCADEARSSMENMNQSEYLGSPYYARWLHFLEDLIVKKGLVTAQEVEAGRVLTSGATGQAGIAKLTVEDCWAFFTAGGSIAMAAELPARFEVGDSVRAKNFHPKHHTRLPRYARGKLGTVVMDHGSFGFSDTRAQGLGDRPQQLYSVRFEAEELWGESAGRREAIHLDLYEEYLDPVAA
ncbi:MAG TPA: nitrile hydratase subunit beta [Burkholderiaceae bacterium]|nr:nitrile hydratase subunit beta [Burkholderiaceae bacterium]